MTKIQLIGACFGLYVLQIFFFAIVYDRLYRRYPRSFYFATELSETQHQTLIHRNRRLLAGLSALSSILPEVRVALKTGRHISEFSKSKKTWSLDSGLTVQIFEISRSAGHHGGTVNSPFIEVRDSEQRPIFGDYPGSGWFFWSEVKTFISFERKISHKVFQTRARLAELASEEPFLWSYWDFLYFSTICQSTVGFGDILPNASSVRLLVSAQIISGYAILVVLLNVILSQ